MGFFNWKSKGPKSLGANHVTYEPVDRVARRVLGRSCANLHASPNARKHRDSFEAKVARLKNGERIKIEANDRIHIQIIFRALDASHQSMTEEEMLNLVCWIVDLRPSTVSHFHKEWVSDRQAALDAEMTVIAPGTKVDFRKVRNRIASDEAHTGGSIWEQLADDVESYLRDLELVADA